MPMPARTRYGQWRLPAMSTWSDSGSASAPTPMCSTAGPAIWTTRSRLTAWRRRSPRSESGTSTPTNRPYAAGRRRSSPTALRITIRSSWICGWADAKAVDADLGQERPVFAGDVIAAGRRVIGDAIGHVRPWRFGRCAAGQPAQIQPADNAAAGRIDDRHAVGRVKVGEHPSADVFQLIEPAHRPAGRSYLEPPDFPQIAGIAKEQRGAAVALDQVATVESQPPAL